MPRDVTPGEGYAGAVLEKRFPGQYRETFTASGYDPLTPGQASGRPAFIGNIVDVPQDLASISPVPQEMADWRGTAFAGLGEDTAWYSRLNAAQNRLIVLQAEFNEIGESNWNIALTGSSYAFEETPWANVLDFTFDKIQVFTLDLIKSLLTTASYQPTTEQISWSEEAAGGLRKLINIVKTLPPVVGAIAEQAEAARVQMAHNLEKSTLASPEDAAKAAFKEDLYSSLKGFGWNILLPIGIGVGVLAAVLIATRK